MTIKEFVIVGLVPTIPCVVRDSWPSLLRKHRSIKCGNDKKPHI